MKTTNVETSCLTCRLLVTSPRWLFNFENIYLEFRHLKSLKKFFSFLFFSEPYDSNPVLISVLNILKGTPIPIDLVRIETQSEVSNCYCSQ